MRLSGHATFVLLSVVDFSLLDSKAISRDRSTRKNEMVITITSLRLKSLFGFFRLSLNGLKISLQAKGHPGFIKMKNTGFGYLHYTLSVWEDQDKLKRFSRSGAHLAAIRQAGSLAREIRIYTFESDAVPNWKDARILLEKNGRVIPYN